MIYGVVILNTKRPGYVPVYVGRQYVKVKQATPSASKKVVTVSPVGRNMGGANHRAAGHLFQPGPVSGVQSSREVSL